MRLDLGRYGHQLPLGAQSQGAVLFWLETLSSLLTAERDTARASSQQNVESAQPT
jgi:hypothetical protein